MSVFILLIDLYISNKNVMFMLLIVSSVNGNMACGLSIIHMKCFCLY